MGILREDFYDEYDYAVMFYDSDAEKEDQPAGEKADELELLEYDDLLETGEDEDSPAEPRKKASLAEQEAEAPPEPDEPLPTDTEAERSGKLLRREMKAEALRRMEESARTRKDFEKVLAAWDKQEEIAERTVRNHLQFWKELPTNEDEEEGEEDINYTAIIPRFLDLPIERQLARGNYIELFSYCPFEMHDLSSKAYIIRAVSRLKPEHKELLFFMGLKGKSPQEMAAIRGQTDRNIRKVWDTMIRKVQKQLYNGLQQWISKGYQPTHREKAFITRYKEEMRVDSDEAV